MSQGHGGQQRLSEPESGGGKNQDDRHRHRPGAAQGGMAFQNVVLRVHGGHARNQQQDGGDHGGGDRGTAGPVRAQPAEQRAYKRHQRCADEHVHLAPEQLAPDKLADHGAKKTGPVPGQSTLSSRPNAAHASPTANAITQAEWRGVPAASRVSSSRIVPSSVHRAPPGPPAAIIPGPAAGSPPDAPPRASA